MKKYLISMDTPSGKRRRHFLNYNDWDYRHTPEPMSFTPFIQDNWNYRHNQRKTLEECGGIKDWESQVKRMFSLMGNVQAWTDVLQDIVDRKIDNVVVLEDDAIEKTHLDIPDLTDLTGACLLGGCFAHPTNWGSNDDFLENDVRDVIDNLEVGVNVFDYSKYRFTQSCSIYFPTWQSANEILESIYADDSVKFTAWDIWLSKKALIKYLLYPSLYVHDDREGGSQILQSKSGQIGYVDNYLNLSNEIKKGRMKEIDIPDYGSKVRQ